MIFLWVRQEQALLINGHVFFILYLAKTCNFVSICVFVLVLWTGPLAAAEPSIYILALEPPTWVPHGLYREELSGLSP